MRMLSILVMSGLIVCSLTVIAEAGCPHCQAIVEVTVELKDGNIRQGYFEYHQEDLPYITAIDGRVTIPLDLLPTAFYPKNVIRLLDTVVVLPGLGKFASLSDIDSIAVADIEQMELRSRLTGAEADRIHFLGAAEIELLSSPNLVRFDTTIDLSVIHYIGLNESVKVEHLQRLARNRDQSGSPQDHMLNHLKILLRNMPQMDDSLFAKYLTTILTGKRTVLLKMQEATDSLVGSDIIGQHFVVVSNHVKQWAGFIDTLLNYLRDGDRQPLDHAILRNQKDSSFPDDIGEHPYEINGTVDRDGITYLIHSYIEGHQLTRILGKNYSRRLNGNGVYVFEQAFD